LIHISELAWHRVMDPGDVLRVGQEVETLIIRLDPNANRIGLSLKRLLPNPWEKAGEIVEAGQVVDGCVSHLSSNGIYVMIAGALEGLLKTSGPPPALRQGEQIKVRVLALDIERERLDLEPVEIEGETVQPV
jgi:small subunit ribosomal protein S1